MREDQCPAPGLRAVDVTDNAVASLAANQSVKALCVPSQNGCLLLCLQPQRNTFFGSSKVNLTGVSPVSLCEPSQNGCLAERPQRHQK